MFPSLDLRAPHVEHVGLHRYGTGNQAAANKPRTIVLLNIICLQK